MTIKQKHIGRILRDKRESEGKSTRLVEKHTGVDQSVLSRIERGINKISLENAVILCEHYGLPIYKLADPYKPRRKGTPRNEKESH